MSTESRLAGQPVVARSGVDLLSDREVHHRDGQALGLLLPSTMHMSVRLGGLALRIRNRVYLPTAPGRVTNSLSVAPGRSNRPSRRRTRTSRVAGRPRPTMT